MARSLLVLLLFSGCGRTAVIGDIPIAAILPETPTVPQGEWLTLDGSKSEDPEGEPLSFAWRILLRPPGANEVLESSVREVARLRPDVAGAWRVELVVTAGTRRSTPAVVNITVTDPLGPPVANAGPDQTGLSGYIYYFDGSRSSDPAGAPFTYAWSMTRPTGSTAVLMDATTWRPSFRADRGGTYEVTLRVSARGLSASDVAVVTVTALNHTPTAVASWSGNRVQYSPVQLDGSRSSDPDGDQLTFAWRMQESPGSIPITFSDPSAVAPTFTPPVPGLYGVELTVTDPGGLSSTAVTSLVVYPGTAIDAGVRDAGFDAGVRDAGFDAGVRDAGLGDAGGTLDGGGYDILDPGEVYIAGTLQEGACYRDALALVTSPNVATTGFDCYFSEETAMISPASGRLVYRNVSESVVREYHCDACPYVGNYGGAVLANDTSLPTACPGANATVAFKVSADGELFHLCSGTSSLWRTAAGVIFYDATADALVAVGSGGWMLTRGRVVNGRTGEQHPLTGVPMGMPITARWNPPDGFFVAFDVGSVVQLWRVPVTGVGQVVGTYPAFPTGFTPSYSSRLDRNGRLYRFARDTSQTFVDAIVRSTVGGTSDVVYTELTNPLVKLHISSLVTGP